MSESIWEELARSPLDPDPDEATSILDWLVPVGLAAAVGLVIGVFVLGNGVGDTTTTTTLAAATTTTSSTIPPDPDPEVPAGYVDIAGMGLDAVAAYGRDGNLYVIVNEVVRSDHTPMETNAFHASHWVLAGDGVEVVSSRTIESSLAPGMKAIEFLGVSALPVAAPELIVRGASEMIVRTGCQGCGATSAHEAYGEVLLEGLDRPYHLADPVLIETGAGITLSIDSLEFTNDWGHVTWHIIDQNEARVRADIRIIFEGTDDPGFEGENPTMLVPENVFQTTQQNPIVANPPPFTTRGSSVLDRAGEPISDENVPTSLLLTWAVEWQHPVGEPIAIPLDGITDLGTID